eukprot:2801447-Pleurochrysis_carterae.AAC.4
MPFPKKVFAHIGGGLHLNCATPSSARKAEKGRACFLLRFRYHGAITAAAVPRLCESALARPEGFRGEYGGHISASQLVFSKELDSAQSASQRWLLDALAGGLGEGARVGKQLVERHRQAAENMQKALARARKLYTK